MGSHYKASPQGIAKHAWVNRPDTKFVADGLYHTGLILEGQAAHDFKDEIDGLVQEAFDRQSKDMKPAEVKKWTPYFPYEVETDEDGKETGRIEFKFKQNALIRLKDGATKKFTLGIRDSKDKATNANVFGGAIIRVMWKDRDIKLATAKQFGIRLDFSMVQLIAQPEGRGGFGEVEGGYVDGADADQATNDAGANEADY